MSESHISEESVAREGSRLRGGWSKALKTVLIGRRSLIVVTVVVIICLIGGSCYVAYRLISKDKVKLGSIPSMESFSKEGEISRKASVMYWEEVAVKGDLSAVNETVEWLKNQDSVKDAGSGDGCIWVEFHDGLKRLILTTDPNIKR